MLRAVVTSRTPLEVRFDGDEVAVPISFHARSYNPQVGDRVWLQELSTAQWMVVDAIELAD